MEAYRSVREVAERAGLTVNADIQNKLLKADLEQRRMLLSSLPRLTLMLYELSSPDDGDSSEARTKKLQDASKRFLNMAYDGLHDSHLAKMEIGLRTPDYRDELPNMLRVLDETNGADSHYVGWARHSYNDWLAGDSQ